MERGENTNKKTGKIFRTLEPKSHNYQNTAMELGGTAY